MIESTPCKHCGLDVVRGFHECCLDAASGHIAQLEAALMEARDLLFSHTPQSDPVWEDKRGAWADGLHNIGRSQSDGARSRRPFSS